MSREALGVDRGRGDDDLEVGTLRQDAAEVPEQEVDVQRALVRLVDDDRVVAAQQPVAVDLVEQDAVGHQRDARVGRHLVGEAHLVADGGAQRHLHLVGDALGDRAGRDAAGLRVRDRGAAELEADLGQLRGLARAGRAGDDHDLVVADRARDLVPRRADGQLGRVDDDGFDGHSLPAYRGDDDAAPHPRTVRTGPIRRRQGMDAFWARMRVTAASTFAAKAGSLWARARTASRISG